MSWRPEDALLVLCLVPLVACSSSSEEGGAGLAMTRPLLAALAAETGVITRHKDVLLVCRPPAGEGWPDCEAKQLTADGSIRPLGVTHILAAQRLRDGKLLVTEVTDAQQDLVVVNPDDGSRVTLAPGISEPRVRDDGVHAVAIRRQGTKRTLVAIDTASGAVTELLADDTMSVAYPAPGRDEVLFVSRRSGLASLWLRDAAGALQQVTNRSGGSKGATPAPVWDPLWLDGRVLVFAGRVGLEESLWRVKVDSGATRRVGAGRLPSLTADGKVLVVVAGKPAPRVVELAPEVVQ